MLGKLLKKNFVSQLQQTVTFISTNFQIAVFQSLIKDRKIFAVPYLPICHVDYCRHVVIQKSFAQIFEND